VSIDNENEDYNEDVSSTETIYDIEGEIQKLQDILISK